MLLRTPYKTKVVAMMRVTMTVVMMVVLTMMIQETLKPATSTSTPRKARMKSLSPMSWSKIRKVKTASSTMISLMTNPLTAMSLQLQKEDKTRKALPHQSSRFSLKLSRNKNP